MVLPIRPRVLALAALLSLGRLEALDRVVTKDFPVRPGCSLKLDTYHGAITVKAGASDHIHVDVHLEPPTEDEKKVDEALKTLQLDMKEEKNVVSIFARNPSETRVRFTWNGSQKIAITYTILVPPDCPLELITGDGGITVGDLKASVVAHASRGTVYLRHIDGDIDASTDKADIVITRCLGSAKLTNLLGGVRTGLIAKTAQISTTNGDIDVQQAPGGIKAYANNGDITVGFPAVISGDADLHTNGGGILARIDPKAHCTVRASSVWGHVHSEVPLQVNSGAEGKRAMNGSLNGGGAAIVLRADGGHVRILQPHI